MPENRPSIFYGQQIDEHDELNRAKKVLIVGGFLKGRNITSNIVTTGSIKTIIETDGLKTLTTTIDKTDPNDISITEIWS